MQVDEASHTGVAEQKTRRSLHRSITARQLCDYGERATRLTEAATVARWVISAAEPLWAPRRIRRLERTLDAALVAGPAAGEPAP